jgi:carboxypeptidase Q
MIRSAALLCIPALVCAQEPIDSALNARLREEGLKKGQVMRLVHELCDNIGPRLTASPSYKVAADWAVGRMKGWGLDAKLEPWDFGHPGWANQWCSAHVTEPYQDPLTVEVLSWTPSTKGLVKGAAVALTVPENPTTEELNAALNAIADKVPGAIVLVGPHKVIPPNFTPAPLRRDEASLRETLDPFREGPARQGGGPGGAGGPARGGAAPAQPKAGALDARAAGQLIDAFLVAHKALVRVDDAKMANGQIRAFNNRTYDLTKVVPTVVMRSEDFGRMWRVMGDGTPVKLAFEITNKLYPESTKGYNVVGELRGSEKPEEVVLLTAHFDSWHTATGATDNGANSVVMMEALRLLKTAGAAPKRTIRVVLYDAEEQGLLGSQAYAKAHYGTFEQPLPEAENVVAMFNMDNGSGQMHGLNILAPKAAAVALHEMLVPWRDIGMVGASGNKNRPARLGGTDITVFTQLGLPGGGPVQDGLEYFNYTWHTTLDTYERVLPEDVARNATVFASVAYHIANRAERLPRWKASDFPPLPAAPATPQR